MFRSLPLFLNGVLLLAVLGSAACSHCEATFVVPEDAQYSCPEDTGNQQAAFFSNCEDDEDLFDGCSPMEQCSYINEQVPACAYCLRRKIVQKWIDQNCKNSCWIEESRFQSGTINISDDGFYIKCR